MQNILGYVLLILVGIFFLPMGGWIIAGLIVGTSATLIGWRNISNSFSPQASIFVIPGGASLAALTYKLLPLYDALDWKTLAFLAIPTTFSALATGMVKVYRQNS